MSEQMFKAWDNHKKKWLNHGEFVIGPDGDVLQILIKLNYAYTIIKADATLCRSTGLRDSKRTEEFPEGEMIFEGDILSWDNKTDEDNINDFVVEFVEGCFCGGGAMLCELDLDSMQIIGNIFEHKHLLEAKQ